jgi:protease-4
MFKKISEILVWMGRHFLGLLLVLIALAIFLPKAERPAQRANLQIIDVRGPILKPDKILKAIDEAKRSAHIKGVLLRVDSPGGGVAPSVEIAYAIKELHEKKPVVAYAAGIMASGAYYASIYADRIVANPGAIVGSIGVILESADMEGLMSKIGIRPQVVKEGTYKEAGTPLRRWTPEERAELERLIKDGYEMFVRDVALARKLDINDSKRYADAHIFSASRAKSVGLVDEVATLSRAKALTAELAKVEKPVWKKKNRFESLVENLTTGALSSLFSAAEGLKAQWRF